MSASFDHVEFDDERTRAEVSIDKKIYSKSAVLKACYWFSRDLWFKLDDVGDRLHLTINVRAAVPTLVEPKVKKVDEWLPEIFNALVDSQLREDIQAETSAIRELIIAKAFAEAGILEDSPPGTFEDPVASKHHQIEALINIKTNPAK